MGLNASKGFFLAGKAALSPVPAVPELLMSPWLLRDLLLLGVQQILSRRKGPRGTEGRWGNPSGSQQSGKSPSGSCGTPRASRDLRCLPSSAGKDFFLLVIFFHTILKLFFFFAFLQTFCLKQDKGKCKTSDQQVPTSHQGVNVYQFGVN